MYFFLIEHSPWIKINNSDNIAHSHMTNTVLGPLLI